MLRLKSQRSVQKFCELAASISLLPTPDFKEGSIARSCKVQYGNLKPELYIVRSGSSFLYLGMVSLLQVPYLLPLNMLACPLLSCEREFIVGG